MQRIVIVFLMFCFLVPNSIEARKKSFGNGFYWELSKDGVLTITGHGEMPESRKPWKSPWRKKLGEVRKVVVCEGVTSLCSYAFRGYTKYPSSIAEIQLPSTLKSIGEYALAYNSRIQSVVIPNSVTFIGKGAFEQCDNLNSVELPNSLREIKDWTFFRCKNLKSIVIPQSVTTIGGGSFYECENLASVQIPNSVTNIGDEAFRRCYKLASIDIPNSVTNIGAGAFRGCVKLTSIDIPNSVTNIGDNAFTACDNLITVTIPNSVTNIGDYAFASCGKLATVTIPSSVKTIGEKAFAWCSLSSLYVPKSVDKIGVNAFGKGNDDDKYFSGQIMSMPEFVIDDYGKYGLSTESAEAYKNGTFDSDGNLLIPYKAGRSVTRLSDNSNSSDYYLVVEEDAKSGILGSDGKWTLPLKQRDYDLTGIIADKYLKAKKNGYCGILAMSGNEIIPFSRNYTSIAYNKSNETFAFTKKGFSGLCNAQGREISSSRLAPTIDEIKANGGYASVSKLTNGGKTYYMVSKNGRYGLTDSDGNVIISTEMEELSTAGNGCLRYKINGFVGLMTFAGKIVIDTDRGYTSIGDYVSFTKRFPYTMAGYKGECDANGKQISKISVAAPQQSVASNGSSSSKKAGNGDNSSSGDTKIIVEHQRQPIPFQEWHACFACGGTGRMPCDHCGGSGTVYIGDNLHRCSLCNGHGEIPCRSCFGNKGQYVTVYK